MAWNLIWEAELDFCQARLGYAKTIGLPTATTFYILHSTFYILHSTFYILHYLHLHYILPPGRLRDQLFPVWGSKR
jgi:hypothetical protein